MAGEKLNAQKPKTMKTSDTAVKGVMKSASALGASGSEWTSHVPGKAGKARDTSLGFCQTGGPRSS